MPDTAPLTPYHAYMLRFWPEHRPTGETQWRFTLIDPGSGQRHGFASLEALVDYLSLLTANATPPNNGPIKSC